MLQTKKNLPKSRQNECLKSVKTHFLFSLTKKNVPRFVFGVGKKSEMCLWRVVVICYGPWSLY